MDVNPYDTKQTHLLTGVLLVYVQLSSVRTLGLRMEHRRWVWNSRDDKGDQRTREPVYVSFHLIYTPLKLTTPNRRVNYDQYGTSEWTLTPDHH